MRRCSLLLLLCSAAVPLTSCRKPPAAPPARISTLTVEDHPQDTGEAIDLAWPGYIPAEKTFAHYAIYRSESPISTVAELKPIDTVSDPEATNYTDGAVTLGADYYYAVTAVDKAGNEDKSVAGAGPVRSAQNVPRPAPPSNVRAEDDRDAPDDPGGVFDISWTVSPDDRAGVERPVTGYEIVRLEEIGGEETVAADALAGRAELHDKKGEPNRTYYYGVRAIAGEARSELALSGPAISYGRWFNVKRVNVMAWLVIYAALVMYFIIHARRGREMYVRPIAGLEALDDAIGRATEMGRPILYISGLTGASDISTIAAMIILGRVARRIAEYETPLIVPCNDPIVMSIEREIVRQAYLEAGHADAFDPDSVFFATDQQFAYVAAVDGIMLRDRPAANIYMGYFFAEALIMAETGASTGAIQIAGTDSDTQLPFFVTTCDYTLIGEELYAATAYLSRDPMLLGSLKGQDWGKVLIAAVLVAGAIIVTLGPHWVQKFLDLFTTA